MPEEPLGQCPACRGKGRQYMAGQSFGRMAERQCPRCKGKGCLPKTAFGRLEIFTPFTPPKEGP